MFIPVIGLGSAMLLTGEVPYVEDYVAVVLIIAALAATLLPSRAALKRSAPP
jgi:drug/metabolite transporter (DMT)-like permease